MRVGWVQLTSPFSARMAHLVLYIAEFAGIVSGVKCFLMSEEMSLSFNLQDEFEYGVIQDVSPLIRRIVAKNPSRFTHYGTGTYIVGRGEVAVIDPGPDLPEHIESIVSNLSGETITQILLTHHHSDHSPASRQVQAASGARIYGRSVSSAKSSACSRERESDAIDQGFSPDIEVSDGDVVEGRGWTIECVHTPGHTSNHICYRLREEKALFSGDHVMGWSTSVIIPPDGSMADYLCSLTRLLDADDGIYYPTHGASVENPKELVRKLIGHRREREEQIRACFRSGLTAVWQMVPVVYRSLDPALHSAAARSLLATIIMMVENEVVRCDGDPKLDSEYRFVG